MTAQDIAKVAKPSVPITASSLILPGPALPQAKTILARTARRYRRCNRFARSYVGMKLRTDPVHNAVLALAASEAFGSVLDLGCGYGQLSAALLEAGLADSVFGLDRSAKHLQQAQVASGPAFQAKVQDLAVDLHLPSADTILLIDVLYQLDLRVQDVVLGQASRAARRRIIIRACDPDRGARSWFYRRVETLFRLVWPNAGLYVMPRPIRTITETLERAGFVVECRPCCRGTPFPNVLLIARRPQAAE